MSMNTRQAIYIENLYEDFYEKHYQELSKTSDDVEWIENEAMRLAEINLDECVLRLVKLHLPPPEILIFSPIFFE